MIRHRAQAVQGRTRGCGASTWRKRAFARTASRREAAHSAQSRLRDCVERDRGRTRLGPPRHGAHDSPRSIPMGPPRPSRCPSSSTRLVPSALAGDLALELSEGQQHVEGLSDLDACNALCFADHGFDRGGELKDAIGQKTATVTFTSPLRDSPRIRRARWAHRPTTGSSPPRRNWAPAAQDQRGQQLRLNLSRCGKLAE
jgi:hypothetical protein